MGTAQTTHRATTRPQERNAATARLRTRPAPRSRTSEAAGGVVVRITPARLRALDAARRELQPYTRTPLTPETLVRLLVDHELSSLGENLAALPGYKAPKLPRRRPAFRDPDLWPADASGLALAQYRDQLAWAVGLGHGGFTTAGWSGWWCSTCEAPISKQGPGCSERRRWWACPKRCNDTAKNRRAAAAFRQAWSWPAEEAKATAIEADRAALRVEIARRYRLRDLLHEAGWQQPPVPALHAARILLTGEGGSCSLPLKCEACAAAWDPLETLVDFGGHSDLTPSDYRGSLPWWQCSKGCNVAAADRVKRAARRAGGGAALVTPPAEPTAHAAA